MSDMNRRTFITTSASLLATGASWMLVGNAETATHTTRPQPSVMDTGMNEHHQAMGEEMQRCIQLCQDCHTRCIQLIDHCVTVGGRSAAPAHIRLLMDCAQLCAVTADFMARASSFHDRTCALCAELCRCCAESCEEVAGSDQLIKQCAEFCRHCAESCDRMVLKGAT